MLAWRLIQDRIPTEVTSFIDTRQNAVLASVAVSATCLGLIWLVKRRRVRGLDTKYVLVTGCDSGFGQRAVIKLDKIGLRVIAGCLTAEGIREVEDKTSDKVVAVLMDVTNRQSVQDVRDNLTALLPPDAGLWGVVNNAGISGPVLTPWSTPDDYTTVLDVNFHGNVNVVDALLPLIKKAQGRIVNVASVLGRCSSIGGPYVVSKFAVEAYSDGLRRYLCGFGVGVSIIEPGFFRTAITSSKMWRRNAEALWDRLSEEEKEEYGLEYKNKVIERALMFSDHLPLAMFNHPDMVADAMVHALTSTCPKKRYLVGLDAHILYQPLALVFDRVNDWFVSFMYPVKPACMTKNKHRS